MKSAPAFTFLANLVTLNPNALQFSARDVVAFQVIDSLDGDSARGDWAGRIPGVVRPLLEWETRFSTNGEEADTIVTEEMER